VTANSKPLFRKEKIGIAKRALRISGFSGMAAFGYPDDGCPHDWAAFLCPAQVAEEKIVDWAAVAA
jgi:hypothetical protein